MNSLISGFSYKRYYVNLILFLFTFVSTTLAGVQWLNKDPLLLFNFPLGLQYSIPLLLILLFHEFGHYFAAKIYHLNTTLPFFIPTPPFLINPFGTMGAVIKLRSPFLSKKSAFDIGIAGPLSGLFVTVIVLLCGFFTLPDKEFIYFVHPEYHSLKYLPLSGLSFGNSLFFLALRTFFSSHAYVPSMFEIYHYPLLCAGWFGLFITAMNLIPVGQLDGGHIMYALIGRKHRIVSRIFLFALLFLGSTGLSSLFLPGPINGTIGWLLWIVILVFIVKIDHPIINDETELDNTRKFLGWTTFIIFFLIFTPIPFSE